MFVSPGEITRRNSKFSPNANANDLQLEIGMVACGESRNQSQGGEVSRLEPKPADADSSERRRGGSSRLLRASRGISRRLDPSNVTWI